MTAINTSPFDPICDELAREFDEADIAKNRDKTAQLIEKAKSVVRDEPAYAPLYYSIGTSLTILRDNEIKKSQSINPYTDSNVVKLHSEVLWYFRHSEELLEKITETDENSAHINGLKLILYVNHGNALDVCGRKCSAISFFSKALCICPTFGMALGNIGRCLEHYASLEGDTGHRAVLFKKAYSYYCSALDAKDQYTYQEAKESFSAQRDKLIHIFGEAQLTSQVEYENYISETNDESSYRSWCLVNHVFLNTLNDLLEQNEAFAADPLQITSITTSVEQKEIPAVFEMFNQVKEEFVYARYLLYEVVHSDDEVHFADKETHLDDVLNYSSYSIRLEKLKTAYRTIYSLLDRIAFLLNDYLNIGMAETAVSFNRLFENQNLKPIEDKNVGIQALHWINRDFKDVFGEADSPHTKKMKDLRNALEHKFVSVHMLPVDNEIVIGTDGIYRVSEEHLIDYTMELMKLVREAIIELTITIRIEEYQRHQENKKTMPMQVHEYLDTFKR